MARRERNLYEILEPDDLTAAVPAPAGTKDAPAGPAADPSHRRRPRIGAGLALVAAIAVLGVLVFHARRGDAPPTGTAVAPVVRASTNRHASDPRPGRRVRSPATRQPHARARARARVPRAHHLAVRSPGRVTLASAPTPRAAVPHPVPQRPRQAGSAAEREFGFER